MGNKKPNAQNKLAHLATEKSDFVSKKVMLL
jgi:hypothetical protein